MREVHALEKGSQIETTNLRRNLGQMGFLSKNGQRLLSIEYFPRKTKFSMASIMLNLKPVVAEKKSFLLTTVRF